VGYRAVIFDLGGVVLGSPLHAIAAYERELGIPEGHVNRVVVKTGSSGAWSRLERGELDLAGFFPAFEAECREHGHPLSAVTMMERIHVAGAPCQPMLEAIRVLRRRGFRVGALTNNWSSEGEESHSELRALFDCFIESSVVGLRKPDPRIYLHTCETLAIAPTEAVFLDDIGRNLKAARALGMGTIKVESPEQALAELAAILGFPLAPT
jgi:putative hydrolase of the HAD superfamily